MKLSKLIFMARLIKIGSHTVAELKVAIKFTHLQILL